MEDHHHQDQKELQLLPAPHNTSITTSSSSSDSLLKLRSTTIGPLTDDDGPSLDLQLSTNLIPIIRPSVIHHHPGQLLQGSGTAVLRSSSSSAGTSTIESLKWQAAEQIWLAAIEKAYAERMRELSRREMELAQNEFSHARNLRDRAKEELDKAEKLKERAINLQRRDSSSTSTSSCMEITCHSCRQKFRP